VAGFLVFNLRRPGRRHALAFLGDAGSLGLARAWRSRGSSGAEGSTPLFASVTAIWLLAVPLVDTRHPTPDTRHPTPDTRHDGLHRAPVAERHQPVQGRSQASAPHPHRPGAARDPGEWRWR